MKFLRWKRRLPYNLKSSRAWLKMAMVLMMRFHSSMYKRKP
ncbi:hypothetical protein NC651_028789 [Populus alba x Populus x berolinensis]|nr:hypothetical protein NC651_028789 [Populus alba x Populus x berolinensis]